MSAVQKLAEALCQNGDPGACEEHCREAEQLALEILRDQGVEPTTPLKAVSSY